MICSGLLRIIGQFGYSHNMRIQLRWNAFRYFFCLFLGGEEQKIESIMTSFPYCLRQVHANKAVGIRDAYVTPSISREVIAVLFTGFFV